MVVSYLSWLAASPPQNRVISRSLVNTSCTKLTQDPKSQPGNFQGTAICFSSWFRVGAVSVRCTHLNMYGSDGANGRTFSASTGGGEWEQMTAAVNRSHGNLNAQSTYGLLAFGWKTSLWTRLEDPVSPPPSLICHQPSSLNAMRSSITCPAKQSSRDETAASDILCIARGEQTHNSYDNRRHSQCHLYSAQLQTRRERCFFLASRRRDVLHKISERLLPAFFAVFSAAYLIRPLITV